MRTRGLLLVLAACGGGDDAPTPDAPIDSPPNQCQPLPATGQFARRTGNPELIAGQVFTDTELDLAFSDPDISFDGSKFDLYYTAEHGAAFGTPGTQVIRHATSTDRMTWTVADAPLLTVAADPGAWDHATTEAPTVIVNPDAPADRRFLMLYAGSKRPIPGRTITESSIGAAISADGITFTRISASESPHGEAGLVMTAADIYAGVNTGTKLGSVDDPELVLVDGVYHLFYSSFTCDGASCANVIANGIGHSTSADGIHWTLVQAPVKSLLRASADDKTGGRAPSAIYDAPHCRFELWQTNDLAGDVANQPIALDNMAGVFHAESSDALQWSVFFTSPRDVAWNQAQPDAGEHLGLRAGADVAQVTSGRLMMFVGYDDQDVPGGSTLPTTNGTRSGVMTIGLATRDLP